VSADSWFTIGVTLFVGGLFGMALGAWLCMTFH